VLRAIVFKPPRTLSRRGTLGAKSEIASGRQTVGLLSGRQVRLLPQLTTHEGNEPNKPEELEAGLEHDAESVWTRIGDIAHVIESNSDRFERLSEPTIELNQAERQCQSFGKNYRRKGTQPNFGQGRFTNQCLPQNQRACCGLPYGPRPRWCILPGPDSSLASASSSGPS
jgi:hypothetical protein